ncbi:MAG: DsbA family protein [Polyangiales bacterium]
MKHLVLITAMAVALVACSQDTKNMEKKLDDMNRKLDAYIAKGGGGGGAGAANAQPQRPARPEPDRAKTYAVPVDGDGFDGPADAKVTIVKAYDYACPYCEKVRDTMEELHKKYGNDLRVVYKQMVVHPRNAMAGALAYCSANKQGKGKDMDRLIWDKGFKARQLDNSDVAAAPAAEAGGAPGGAAGGTAGGKCWDSPGGCAIVVGFAQELGLNVDKFKSDMKGECQQLVQKDMKDLSQLGVGATPSFFINGRFISGAVPIENFSAVIDEELKKANERVQQGTPGSEYYNQWVIAKGQKTLQ